MLTCILHVRLQKELKCLLIHLLQTNDVGIEAQYLMEDEGSPQCGFPIPTKMQQSLHMDQTEHM